jgi:hypothetical protein
MRILDLDEEAGASLRTIRTSGDVPPPNFVLDISPGKHRVVWRVEGFDTTRAESLLRALASQYGGDPAATDISRLFRFPGFANRKYKQDFHIHEDSPESPKDLPESLGGTRRMPTVTAASRKQTGLTRNEPWPAGMILKSSFNASLTIAPTTKATRFTTLGAPSQRHRLNWFDRALPVGLPKGMKRQRGNPA